MIDDAFYPLLNLFAFLRLFQRVLINIDEPIQRELIHRIQCSHPHNAQKQAGGMNSDWLVNNSSLINLELSLPLYLLLLLYVECNALTLP